MLRLKNLMFGFEKSSEALRRRPESLAPLPEAAIPAPLLACAFERKLPQHEVRVLRR